ncbi:MAG: hypothetical protein HYV27_02410 [Candidatus Hydrogenedentes bacterium]|nr:hypothetical protein [Candidatus Hydrogenedentota bacterium]
MTEKELKRQIAAVRKTRRKVCATKESAQAFLMRAGIVTRSGKLAKAYR